MGSYRMGWIQQYDPDTGSISGYQRFVNNGWSCSMNMDLMRINNNTITALKPVIAYSLDIYRSGMKNFTKTNLNTGESVTLAPTDGGNGCVTFVEQ